MADGKNGGASSNRNGAVQKLRSSLDVTGFIVGANDIQSDEQKAQSVLESNLSIFAPSILW